MLSHCTLADNGGDGLHLISQTTGAWGSTTNSIVASHGGCGINLDGGAGVFACPEGYNVFFNNAGHDIRVNGASQSPTGGSTVADPLFKARGARPDPWYRLDARSSPAFATASDGGNRGAYQNVPPLSGSVIILR